MKPGRRKVALVLNDQGREALALAGLQVPSSPQMTFVVRETNDIGIWVEVEREDGAHFVLVRWEYVLCADLQAGEPGPIGLRP